MILRKSACFVTSTLTQRLLRLRSMVSSNAFAAGLACFSALLAYVCVNDVAILSTVEVWWWCVLMSEGTLDLRNTI